ncbi:lysophospholipid acyltransferase family protein [Gemelliphila palaticanis]|uniref:1-acyl-sn-glycerol-3-phosphate acyltransferase n=1 Tax=Gemelliphila palaticanis TaxID=81950 RepID=A0ABX2T083_9BACL|nr:lysophospholipid acyltransferase family protein [Gemella palaticanis]MBF0714894.1 1-acyl-sn-glycerol-3-phosphate acyltransferase [Gemella palaticanis]NYS46824.1 1-acyl-sn-glycerol-3-phosphate acyltransferase [Gemella palaticanis]
MFNLLKIILSIYYKLFYKITIKNAEKFENSKGVVVSGNHLSNHDSLLFFPFFNNKIRFIAKEEVFSKPIISNFVKSTDAIPVKRGTFDRACINESIKSLKEGINVGIFPEGTRSKDKDLKLGESHNGVSLISTRAEADVLTFAIIPVKNFRIFSEIKIVFGDFINTSELKKQGLKHDEITKIIMNSIENIIKSEK